jgi:predicted protein tyrosine phosphatase
MKTVLFMPRVAAERLYGDPCAAIISITDNVDASLNGSWGSILRLKFNDCVDPLNLKGRRITLFTPEMANDIRTFVECLDPDINTLVVHCEAGISRSAAVAFVLAGHYGWELKGGDTDRANKLVMRVLVDTLES